MAAEPVSRPWRRFLRFNLRGLIVFVIVIGGGPGWLVRGARIQRDAVAAIESGGGDVLYRSRIMDLDLSNTQITDAGLVHPQGLKSLWKLNLSGTRVTDAWITHMMALANLRYILLDRTQVTGAGVKELKQALPRLTFLH